MSTEDEFVEDGVLEQVRSLVAEAMGRDRALVTADASLMKDLGVESLDFLDIVFQIERTFGIQITRGEIERAARGDMTDEEFAPAGVLSEAGLARLRQLMPESAGRIHAGLRPAQIPELFTVRTLVRIVTTKQAAERSPAPG